jgi:hypothetical protein
MMATILRFPSPAVLDGRRYMAMSRRADQILRSEFLRAYDDHGNEAAKDLAECLIWELVEWSSKIIGPEKTRQVFKEAIKADTFARVRS